MSPFTYEYPRPMVTVDAVVLAPGEKSLEVLLIRRLAAPFAGKYALPGGYLELDEELEKGARRELLEETGIRVGPVLQIGAFGNVRRDPRGRTISVAFVGVLLSGPRAAKAGDDASAAAWWSIEALPGLAFDHRAVLEATLTRLRELAEHRPAQLIDLLPARFDGDSLTRLWSAVLGRRKTRAALVRSLESRGLIVPDEKARREGRYRRVPAGKRV